VFGAAAVIMAILSHMRERGGGTIVNITSMSGHAPWAGTAWYGASKYALECLGQSLADEVRHLGMRVMNAVPGGLRTSFAGRSLIRAERSIDDYATSAHNAERSLSAATGKERGDPVRAAQAIVAMLDRNVPPRHLFLGEDAHHHLTEAMDAVRSDFEAFMPVHFEPVG
jgi:short-subunit dehydrogenase